jgi:hypothetical protein
MTETPVIDVAASSRAATAAGASLLAGPKEPSGGNPLSQGASPHHLVTGTLTPRTELSLGAPRPRGIDERHRCSLVLEVIAVG